MMNGMTSKMIFSCLLVGACMGNQEAKKHEDTANVCRHDDGQQPGCSNDGQTDEASLIQTFVKIKTLEKENDKTPSHGFAPPGIRKNDSELIKGTQWPPEREDVRHVSLTMEDLKAKHGMSRQDCLAKLHRYQAINNQDLSGHVGADPEFPPELSSIAAAGTSCGDSAQGISESCEQYNHWQTFQFVAEQRARALAEFGELESDGLGDFKVIGPSGVSFDDVDQGSLGNCYMLSAIASVAYTHPDAIEDMFVDRHLWSQNIFQNEMAHEWNGINYRC
jgi:hypothetical protein